MTRLPRPPAELELSAVGARLRRHRLDDLDELHAAIEESRDHLRPWMPWADQPRATTAGFLERSVQSWDDGREFGYVVVDADDDAVLGGIGLDQRLGPGALAIGYWRRTDAGGRGVVTAAAGALTDEALALVERVEIHCDEANLASAAIPRRLGYALERIDERPIVAPGEHGRSMIWVRRRPVSP